MAPNRFSKQKKTATIIASSYRKMYSQLPKRMKRSARYVAGPIDTLDKDVKFHSWPQLGDDLKLKKSKNVGPLAPHFLSHRFLEVPTVSIRIPPSSVLRLRWMRNISLKGPQTHRWLKSSAEKRSVTALRSSWWRFCFTRGWKHGKNRIHQ